MSDESDATSRDDQTRGDDATQAAEDVSQDAWSTAETYDEWLKPYGVSRDQLYPESLVVPPEKLLHVTASVRGKAKATGKGFAELRPQSIGDVKRWLGVPDEVAKRAAQCCMESPSSLALGLESAEVRKLPGEQQRPLYDLARAYVHGDSTRVAHYESHLNQFISDAIIVGVFVRGDIDVHGVLELGPDVRLLWARNIRIWPSGQIRVLAGTKIDCITIGRVRSGLTTVSEAVLSAKPHIGHLSELEVDRA